TERGLVGPQGAHTDQTVCIPDADPGSTTDPTDADTDDDELLDGEEDVNSNGKVDEGETDPNVADTDGDGLPDGEEVEAGFDPLRAWTTQGGGCRCDATGAPRGSGLVLLLGALATGLRRRRVAAATAALLASGTAAA